MKKLLIAFVSSLNLISVHVFAEDSKIEISTNVAYTSNYLFYGASQTMDGPAISGGFDLALDHFIHGLYVGTWASSVEQGGNNSASLELDFYGGIAHEFSNGVGLDLGLWFYTYPDQDADASVEDFDYFEAYSNLNYGLDVPFAPSLSIGVYYSPEYFGSTLESFYIPAGIDISLPNDIGAYFSYGYFDLENIGEYSHYSIGLTKTILGLDADVSWSDDDGDCTTVQGVECGGFVFALSKSF